MKMNEELEQLLKNLKLRRILDIYDEQLRAAEKEGRLLYRVCAASAARPMARPPGARSGVAHPKRQSARTLVAGHISLRPPARRQPQADPRLCRTRLRHQGENIVFIGPTGVGKTGLASGFCSRPSKTATAASSSALRIYSMKCMPHWPTAPPVSF